MTLWDIEPRRERADAWRLVADEVFLKVSESMIYEDFYLVEVQPCDDGKNSHVLIRDRRGQTFVHTLPTSNLVDRRTSGPAVVRLGPVDYDDQLNHLVDIVARQTIPEKIPEFVLLKWTDKADLVNARPKRIGLQRRQPAGHSS